jgi:putative methyltransferase (TIGR04325 family)
MVWGGVYESFEAAQAGEAAFVHPTWIEKSIHRLHSEMASGHLNTTAASTTVNGSLIVGPILASHRTGRPVVVLDVGGNLGQLGISTQRNLEGVDLDWHVLERPDFLHACSSQTTLPNAIHFYTDAGEVPSIDIDVLHFGSSLQYIDDWAGYVGAAVARHKPTWIVVADAMAGRDIPTFVTKQKYYEQFLVSRFLNLTDLSGGMREVGYDLIYCAPFVSDSNSEYYPELGLPLANRIPFPLDLIYRRQ